MTSEERRTRIWRLADRSIAIDRPIVVGILNTTPDSFSDGGQFDAPDRARSRADAMIAEGADVIDVGGESTRPQGATRVSTAEELRRVIPVIEAIARDHPEIPISVDTTKSEVVRAALDAGAAIVNDVSAFRLDPEAARLCAERGCGVILMHSRGDVSDMGTYAHADYGDAVEDVIAELSDRLEVARAAGVGRDRVVVDPGIGFAKRTEHSLAVLHDLDRIVSLGYPVMVGVSRKRFVGELSGREVAAERVIGSVGASVAALMRGARLFRVHDVRAHREALDVAWAIVEAPHPPSTVHHPPGQ